MFVLLWLQTTTSEVPRGTHGQGQRGGGGIKEWGLIYLHQYLGRSPGTRWQVSGELIGKGSAVGEGGLESSGHVLPGLCISHRVVQGVSLCTTPTPSPTQRASLPLRISLPPSLYDGLPSPCP